MPVTMAEVRNRNHPARIAQMDDFPNTEDFNTHVTARIFGIFAETAGPIVEHFHSDLYHDALYLGKQIAEWDRKKPITWYWSVDDCGTNFHSDAAETHTRKYFFKCELTVESRSYGDQIQFAMTRMDKENV
jgi:hypothetical protein